MTENKDDVLDLIPEVADWIKAHESMGIGRESTRTSLLNHFRNRLIDALLADLAPLELDPALVDRCEARRKAYRDSCRPRQGPPIDCGDWLK